MYWLDGSSELPYTPKSSYLLSKTRTRAIALAQDLIENQARIVKSCVKYNNFHHWCTEASELVDLVIDLAGMRSISSGMDYPPLKRVSVDSVDSIHNM